MILSDKQLKIMEWADKTISVHILIKVNWWPFFLDSQDVKAVSEDCKSIYLDGVWDAALTIIGHPMTYGRLCYLTATARNNWWLEDPLWDDMLENIEISFRYDIKNYQKTVLDRPEALQYEVYEHLAYIDKFLKSLPKEGWV